MMKKSVCLSQDSNLGSLIYLYGLIQPIRGRNRVKSNHIWFKKYLCTEYKKRETEYLLNEIFLKSRFHCLYIYIQVYIYFFNLNQIYFEIVTFKKRKKNLTLPTLNSMNCFSQFLQSRFSRVVIFGGVAVVLRAADFLAMFTLG